jgi:hypothetical protein
MAGKGCPIHSRPDRRPRMAVGHALVLTLALLVPAFWLAKVVQGQDSASPPAASSTSGPPAAAKPILPRGKKLILTDGSFHLVREYRVQGDRVRYYSIDRSQWEEIPTALVDWDATKKVEADEAQRDAAVVAKVHKQESARLAQPLDIDASLEVAPGIFLPDGDLLFVFDGKTVLPLPQAETSSKLAKGHRLAQIMIPTNAISTRYSVSILGAHAKFRVPNGPLEFYMRTADGREPEIELIRTKSHGDSRLVENLDELFGEKHATRDTLSMQIWEVAHGVYRFMPAQSLAPGDYALAEIVRDQGMSLYVWDFGINQSGAAAAAKPPQ